MDYSYYINIYFFFFNDTATTEIYTLSLHDALPICSRGGDRLRERAGGDHRAGHPGRNRVRDRPAGGVRDGARSRRRRPDRKSTRLNSSHANISYAVFCLKKKQI